MTSIPCTDGRFLYATYEMNKIFSLKKKQSKYLQNHAPFSQQVSMSHL